MNTSSLFTVIIPCRNRAEYLAHTLKTCSLQEYEPFEVIVSDDGSTDHTREVVESAMRRDHRIRYCSHDPGIGMRDNFEYALGQVKPGYVIGLGGDDGLLPNGIRGMSEVLRETDMELLAWPAPVYIYPNVRGPYGQLAFYREKGVRIVESKRFLARQVATLHYLSDIESPMFYVKGVASTKLVDRVRRRSRDERFYSCPTPDGYSGIVLAGEVERFAFSAKPFAIYGLSPSSQGLAYLSNEKKAKKESEHFYRTVISTPMHKELASQPYSPLITLMTVDYLLTARDLSGWPGRFPAIDFRRVLRNGIKELAHGLYGEERLCRELKILEKIAEKHDLGEAFRKKIRSSKRRRQKKPFSGSGISPMMCFLDAQEFGVENIVDAAYAAANYYRAFEKISFSMLFKALAGSVKYRMRSLARGASFPPESEWSECCIKKD